MATPTINTKGMFILLKLDSPSFLFVKNEKRKKRKLINKIIPISLIAIIQNVCQNLNCMFFFYKIKN